MATSKGLHEISSGYILTVLSGHFYWAPVARAVSASGDCPSQIRMPLQDFLVIIHKFIIMHLITYLNEH